MAAVRWPRLREHVAAAGYLAGWKLVRFIPHRLAAWAFDRLADAASDRGRGPEQLRRNLSRVVGPANVTRQLVRDSMRSYMRYWLEAFRLPSMCRDPRLHAELAATTTGLEHLDASLAAGRGVVITAAHSGNWDLAACFLVWHQGPITTVAERLKPEVLYDAFVDYRQQLGFEVLPLTGGSTKPYPRLKQVLQSGGVVCLLGDRDLTRSGVTVEFMGEPANIAAGPAQLAIETGAALHVVHSWFTAQGWGHSVSPALEVTTLAQTCQLIADHFAENIRAHPADWHMLQPQWNVDVEQRRRRQRGRRATPRSTDGV